MAAISAPPGACFPARLNLSSTSRPGSIPIPIRCRDFRPICSPACPILLRSTRSPRRPRAPMARPRRRMSCPRRGRRFCCRWSPVWCRPAARPFWRRPIPNMRALRRSPDTASTPCASLDDCGDAALVIVANPNNPDGRLLARADALLALARDLRRRGGLLVIDEAFMDVRAARRQPRARCRTAAMLSCCARSANSSGLPDCGWVLRLPRRRLAERLRAALGPWAVSGPALAVGTQALADAHWIERTRVRLDKASGRIDGILSDLALPLVGGTSLFRLVRTPAAGACSSIWDKPASGCARFPDNANWLRFGLPAGEPQWKRLKNALVSFW